ncbi:universal stress protein [Salinadaptatus halalkaliphilus]|uniref:Universal stress protein n=1 Tax=Salinadaptatus halalkaliphilus TaxID=2419781 RepID=A0A4S3TLF3_9EURY|nr:universal stress protein [Salinadaptatus halalkaliphilus]THE64896.1 universal stress protein [Salinadaptatus halalkaliphilus]
MSNSATDRPVLVAVVNPDRVRQLVRTASDLARVRQTHVRIVSIVTKSRASPFSIYTDDVIVERFAQDTQDVLDLAVETAPDDVVVEREIVVGRSVAEGVRTAVSEVDAQALVVGWHERRTRTDAVLGTTLDHLIEHAPCDLYVERIGYEADSVDSILLPVAGGPHVRPAAHAAKAIAARNDATVSVLAVTAPDGDADTARDDVTAAVALLETAPGSHVDIATAIETDEDVPSAIVDTAPDHDVIVFGVTRQRTLHRRLVGSIPQRVIPRTEQTVLLARSATVVEQSRLSQLRSRLKL